MQNRGAQTTRYAVTMTQNVTILPPHLIRASSLVRLCRKTLQTFLALTPSRERTSALGKLALTTETASTASVSVTLASQERTVRRLHASMIATIMENVKVASASAMLVMQALTAVPRYAQKGVVATASARLALMARAPVSARSAGKAEGVVSPVAPLLLKMPSVPAMVNVLRKANHMNLTAAGRVSVQVAGLVTTAPPPLALVTAVATASVSTGSVFAKVGLVVKDAS